jgi:hypothetical protein
VPGEAGAFGADGVEVGVDDLVEAALVEVFITGAHGADGQGSQSVLGRTVGETIGGRAIVPQEGA